MTFECRSPVFSNEDGSVITLEYNHPRFGWIEFSATPDDFEEHGRLIYVAALSGEYGEVEPYVSPPPQYKNVFSVLEFRERFTYDEQVAIKEATFSDAEVGVVYDNFLASQFIDLQDPRVFGGLTLYAHKGLLTPERVDELMEPDME